MTPEKRILEISAGDVIKLQSPVAVNHYLVVFENDKIVLREITGKGWTTLSHMKRAVANDGLLDEIAKLYSTEE